MMAYDVEPGDRVHPGDPVTVDRYTGGGNAVIARRGRLRRVHGLGVRVRRC